MNSDGNGFVAMIKQATSPVWLAQRRSMYYYEARRGVRGQQTSVPFFSRRRDTINPSSAMTGSISTFHIRV